MRRLLFMGTMLFILISGVEAQLTLDHVLPDSDALPRLVVDVVQAEPPQSWQHLPRSASMHFALPKSDHNPFFCVLEDKIRKTSGILCKFRLGSVQYVDALEGKSYFHAVANSQTTKKQMKVNPKR